MAPPLLTLQNISLTLGGTPLLASAELSVSRGERVCLVGRNGSGKSTTDIIVDPWPFATSRVEVQVEGKRLAGPYENDGALFEAFDAAESVVLEAILRPA